ncbi:MULTISPECIES: hypothetical protein [Aureimonas]|jgi:hypothetical protein|uniref:Uncharacterized protein n=1 Tax=Aureimonas flava TaxID=2320271 RepID=A0A3A1WJC6_9HYPH|nr:MULTISPECIES: hypothetical protein [Aureimonas]RIX99124.1 hypothetical protein D3218_15225 [Aureimonas flava]
MPTAHRQIADAARAAWDHATTLILAARIDGTSRADLDAIADYADEQRDRWLRADCQARREQDRSPDPLTVLSALDYGINDPFGEPGDGR